MALRGSPRPAGNVPGTVYTEEVSARIHNNLNSVMKYTLSAYFLHCSTGCSILLVVRSTGARTGSVVRAGGDLQTRVAVDTSARRRETSQPYRRAMVVVVGRRVVVASVADDLECYRLPWRHYPPASFSRRHCYVSKIVGMLPDVPARFVL